MSTMADLIAFLAKRYDEAEAKANAARHDAKGEWKQEADEVGTGYGHLRDDEGEVVVYDEGSPTDRQFDHIAACDPAHRLADIALKRAILAEHPHYRSDWNWTGRTDLDGPFGCATCDFDRDFGQGDSGWCETVRQLGTEFSAHQDYRDAYKIDPDA